MPAVSAGDPGSGRVTTSRQSGPSGVQPSVPSVRLGGDLGADPLELAADALQALAVLLGRQVGGVRVVEGLDHPADGALDERRPIDLAAGVPVVDGVVGLPERLERGRLGGRRARVGGGLPTDV